MTRNDFMYDGTLNENMLAVGQTRCGKSSFVQRLGKKQNVWKYRLSRLDVEN